MTTFLGYCKNIFAMPTDFVLPPHLLSAAETWERHFESQLCDSKFGYPRGPVYKTPVLDDQLKELLLPSLGSSRLLKKRPRLCLSHDVDYLTATTPMNLKRAVATRSWAWKRESYVDSLKKIIDFDLSVASSSTLFMAAPAWSPNPLVRARQWLLDPSYQEQDSEFQEILEHISRPSVEIGLHGSFFSQQKNLLDQEKAALSKMTSRSVTSGRQHWLNLPEPRRDLAQLVSAGISVDSTLGWNGYVGFRGGICHPMVLATRSGDITLLPMLLMDGPLFDDLKLSQEDVVAMSVALLEEVFIRGGTVSIDWHERGAHPSYNWFAAYEKIVLWAKQRGFEFIQAHESASEGAAL